jgi:chaperone required for assembly of F1-ATPase
MELLVALVVSPAQRFTALQAPMAQAVAQVPMPIRTLTVALAETVLSGILRTDQVVEAVEAVATDLLGMRVAPVAYTEAVVARVGSPAVASVQGQTESSSSRTRPAHTCNH